MIRRQTVLAAAVALVFAAPATASAQEEPTIEIEPTEGEGEPPTDQPIVEPEIEVEPEATPAPVKPLKGAAGAKASWGDVVVVKHKPFLKNSRLELIPTIGITLNDNMIRHFQFAGQLNYWLTDALAVGVEGSFFRRDLLEPYELIATQYRRLPTLNQYNFGAALNFHYVPIYAKFAVLNNQIIHWEAYFTAGVGLQQSEVLPRDPALPGWTNMLITPNVGFTMRVFITRFITFNIGVRDYLFNDKFESVNRTSMDTLDEAMEAAEGKLVNHIVFQAGLSFWFPMSFRYTTFR